MGQARGRIDRTSFDLRSHRRGQINAVTGPKDKVTNVFVCSFTRTRVLGDARTCETCETNRPKSAAFVKTTLQSDSSALAQLPRVEMFRRLGLKARVALARPQFVVRPGLRTSLPHMAIPTALVGVK